jgi:hypothetical protein
MRYTWVVGHGRDIVSLISKRTKEGILRQWSQLSMIQIKIAFIALLAYADGEKPYVIAQKMDWRWDRSYFLSNFNRRQYIAAK